MIPWEEIERARVLHYECPGGEELVLRRRGQEFSIRTSGTELMNSRVHGSEDALAVLTHKRMRNTKDIKVLIGGLGMGFTLAAALDKAAPGTCVTVAELVPEVIEWNQKYLGHLAGNPLDDPRVKVEQGDVAKVMARALWDAIILDVDNGPAGLTSRSNDRLYGRAGLKLAFSSLAPGGVLSVWSSGPDDGFTRRLKQCGFKAETVLVRSGQSGKGGKHTIWLAVKP